MPCEVYPCKNGGICSDEKDGGFKCACRNGYGGLLCDQKGIRCISLRFLFPTNINMFMNYIMRIRSNSVAVRRFSCLSSEIIDYSLFSRCPLRVLYHGRKSWIPRAITAMVARRNRLASLLPSIPRWMEI